MTDTILTYFHVFYLFTTRMVTTCFKIKIWFNQWFNFNFEIKYLMSKLKFKFINFSFKMLMFELNHVIFICNNLYFSHQVWCRHRRRSRCPCSRRQTRQALQLELRHLHRRHRLNFRRIYTQLCRQMWIFLRFCCNLVGSAMSLRNLKTSKVV